MFVKWLWIRRYELSKYCSLNNKQMIKRERLFHSKVDNELRYCNFYFFHNLIHKLSKSFILYLYKYYSNFGNQVIFVNFSIATPPNTVISKNHYVIAEFLDVLVENWILMNKYLNFFLLYIPVVDWKQVIVWIFSASPTFFCFSDEKCTSSLSALISALHLMYWFEFWQ